MALRAGPAYNSPVPQTRQVKLASRPVGLPTRDNWDFGVADTPALADGQVLVEIHYVSLDPAMRGWMNDQRSYIRPVRLGEVMRAGTVGKVVESKHASLRVGDYVVGNQGVQTHAVASGDDVHKVDPDIAPLERYLGTLGMPGMTAYFGLLDVGEPKAEETVVVSGAAGAVGSVVGQIAKLKGCRVVGIAGGEAKCAYLTDQLGFDAAIDYKAETVRKRLRDTCPDRIDVYFDNVGGDILDDCLAALNMRARVVLCGAISQYNATEPVRGPANYLSLLVNRARMEGVIVFDYADRYHQAAAEMAGWIAEGKLHSREHVVEGLDRFPETLNMLFSGGNFGKLVLKVA